MYRRKKTFWTPWHHVTDAEVVIPKFGHYVKLASNLGATRATSAALFNFPSQDFTLDAFDLKPSVLAQSCALNYHW